MSNYTTNSHADRTDLHREVQAAFPYEQHINRSVVYEHDQQWLCCHHCGAQWAVHESNLGLDFEQVSDGDGYCDERYCDER